MGKLGRLKVSWASWAFELGIVLKHHGEIKEMRGLVD